MSNGKNVIQTFEDGTSLEFDVGQFDEWCIYLKTSKDELYGKWCSRTPNGYAPKDEKYFGEVAHFAQIHSSKKVYSDFVKIYDNTKSSIEQHVFDLISDISNDYGQDSMEIQILFCILYAGMVAEENKKYSVLGKRIKRLGIHQLLMDEKTLSAKEAANFSKGKKAYRYQDDKLPLNDECQNRGF